MALAEEDEKLARALKSVPLLQGKKQVQLEQLDRPSVPPWLERYKRSATDGELDQSIAWLEYGMLEKGFTGADVQEIVRCIHMTAGGNLSKMTGIVDFLRLILQLKFEEPQGRDFVTREVLLASILHYEECLTAREQGVYDWIQVAIQSRKRTDQQVITSSEEAEVSITLCPPAASYSDPTISSDDALSSALAFPAKSSTLIDVHTYEEQWDDEVRTLAKGAARIKRAEILAHTVLGASRMSSKEEASRLRGLLLSVMDDWRALALRCVACLYRLEGIMYDWENGRSQYLERTPDVIQTAKDALKVYATLSQRLGMHGLKAQLEDRAFRILYRRQYQAVSSLYRETGGVMQSVASYMTSQINQVLSRDAALMEQLEVVQVSARVKEPFSFWKKLLKVRGSKSSLQGYSTGGSLSVTNVQDGVALRVVLQARKWTPDEPDETTSARERLLCYYVQHLIRSRWPAVDKSRIKDYIQNPKANGYQSLHFTSSISCRGLEFPFEIQVRSEDMHRSAEFGVAAHWDYKLASKPIKGMAPATIGEQTLLESGALAVACKGNVVDIPNLCGHTTTPSLPEKSTRPLNISYIDALVNSKQRLVQQSVYAFFTGSYLKEQGRLVALPVGARISDGISELCKDVDDDYAASAGKNVAVWRNGRLAAISDLISNGDVIMVDAYS